MSSVIVLRLKFVIAACVIAGLIYWLSFLLPRDSAAVMANSPQPTRFSDSAATIANLPQPSRYTRAELLDMLHKCPPKLLCHNIRRKNIILSDVNRPCDSREFCRARKRGKRSGLSRRLRKHPSRSPLPSFVLASVRSLRK